MLDLIKRRQRMRHIVVIAAAIGCSCATFSGTVAAIALNAQPLAPAAAERLA